MKQLEQYWQLLHPVTASAGRSDAMQGEQSCWIQEECLKLGGNKEIASADLTVNITQRALLFNGFSSKNSKKNLYLNQRKFGRLQLK